MNPVKNAPIYAPVMVGILKICTTYFTLALFGYFPLEGYCSLGIKGKLAILNSIKMKAPSKQVPNTNGAMKPAELQA